MLITGEVDRVTGFEKGGGIHQTWHGGSWEPTRQERPDPASDNGPHSGHRGQPSHPPVTYILVSHPVVAVAEVTGAVPDIRRDTGLVTVAAAEPAMQAALVRPRRCQPGTPSSVGPLPRAASRRQSRPRAAPGRRPHRPA